MAEAPRRAVRITGFATATILFLADQIVKWLLVAKLNLPAQPIRIAPIFELHFVQNYGVSMGYLLADTNGKRWLLVAITAAIAAIVLAWLWRERSRADGVALGLVLGGALGNILDRVRLGYVTDYADLHFGGWRPFLVFNVADAAITLGVALLLLRALFGRGVRGPVEDMHA